jgi:hypothetical protein
MDRGERNEVMIFVLAGAAAVVAVALFVLFAATTI